MPPDPNAWLTTLQQLLNARHLDEAEALCREQLAQIPDDPPALHALGWVLTKRGDHDTAEDLVCRAIERAPSATYFNTLGLIHGAAGRGDEAEQSFRLAIQLQPNLAIAHGNLAELEFHRGHLDEAIAGFTTAQQLAPQEPMHLISLGAVFAAQGRHPEVLDACRRAVELAPNRLDLYHHLLYYMWFTYGLDPKLIVEQHRVWGELAQDFAQNLPHDNDPDPDRRLRIGYVSPDLREHVIGYFMNPILAAHDPAAVETFCYFHGRREPLTDQLRSHAHHWIDTHDLDDEQLAARIRADRIDILIDLSLHMAFNRLLLFVRRPAPVQATYLSYPGTSGLPQMDYRITDPLMEPPDHPDGWLGPERLARLRECYWCYRPPPQAPPPANAPPSQRNNFITFACTNNYMKVNPQMVAIWSQLLGRVPGSRLRLSVRGGAAHNQSVVRAITAAGIDRSRFDLLDQIPYADYLRSYNDIDIALDPYPYNGGTTTFDALYMGVPVVTLAGQLPVSRFGLTILTNLGLSELIAHSPDQYIAIASALAADPNRIATFRRDLRPRLVQSHLTNPAHFTQNLEATYRSMWHDWCRRHRRPASPESPAAR